VFNHVLTTDTPLGRKVRPRIDGHAGPLIRVKPKDLAAAGVERLPRIDGVKGGFPATVDGRVIETANVIWCTGFHPAFDWIDLPLLKDDGRPEHRRGVTGEPGLYFLGLGFLYAFSSMMIQGVSRDADFIAGKVAERVVATTAR
jgi:putative flavoprotein involved in K+ transport